MYVLALSYAPPDGWSVISDSKSWRVYRCHAEKVKSALLAAHPDLTVVLNPEKPRKKSFDITLLDGGKGEEGKKGVIQE